MSSCPVTIRHPEGYVLGLLLPISLLPVLVEPVHTLSLFEILLFCALGVTGLYGLYRAASWEQLDETGILVKRPFFSKGYLWPEIQKVQLVPLRTTRGQFPQFLITLPDRSTPLRLRCTGTTLDAIRSWYGEPDEDLWGNGIA